MSDIISYSCDPSILHERLSNSAAMIWSDEGLIWFDEILIWSDESLMWSYEGSDMCKNLLYPHIYNLGGYSISLP